MDSYAINRIKELKTQRKNTPCKHCKKPVGESKKRHKLFCSELCRVSHHAVKRKEVRVASKERGVGVTTVSLRDLPWVTRVRSGELTPLHGEFCYCCGKLSKLVHSDPMKRVYCSNVCLVKAQQHGYYDPKLHKGYKQLAAHYLMLGAQRVLKQIQAAERILNRRMSCDYCERKVRFIDCGQKIVGDVQPSTWVGSHKPQYLFCAPICRQYFYRTFSGYSYPPAPINKRLVVNDFEAMLLKDALGQENPLQHEQLNAIARSQVPFLTKGTRQSNTGTGVPIYKAMGFVKLTNAVKRQGASHLLGAKYYRGKNT